MSFSRALRTKANSLWEQGYHHPFVQGVGTGTLDKDIFKFFLLQDYVYLFSLAKIYALGLIKADTELVLSHFASMQHGILSFELDMHRTYMRGFGITQDQIDNVKPSLFNKTYTDNILSIGITGDLSEILAAVLSISWVYYDYTNRLKVDYEDKLQYNFYRTWIENYARDDYYDSFSWMYEELDRFSQSKTEKELIKLEDIFISCIEFSNMFFDMSYKKEMTYRSENLVSV